MPVRRFWVLSQSLAPEPQDGARWETAGGSDLMGDTTAALLKRWEPSCDPDLPHLQTQIWFYPPPQSLPPVTMDTDTSNR